MIQDYDEDLEKPRAKIRRLDTFDRLNQDPTYKVIDERCPIRTFQVAVRSSALYRRQDFLEEMTGLRNLPAGYTFGHFQNDSIARKKYFF